MAPPPWAKMKYPMRPSPKRVEAPWASHAEVSRRSSVTTPSHKWTLERCGQALQPVRAWLRMPAEGVIPMPADATIWKENRDLRRGIEAC